MCLPPQLDTRSREYLLLSLTCVRHSVHLSYLLLPQRKKFPFLTQEVNAFFLNCQICHELTGSSLWFQDCSGCFVQGGSRVLAELDGQIMRMCFCSHSLGRPGPRPSWSHICIGRRVENLTVNNKFPIRGPAQSLLRETK